MGSAFAEFSDWKCLLMASIFTIGVEVVIFHLRGMLLITTVAAFIALVTWRLERLLGGLTGDTYGTLCELTETFCLMVLSTKWI